MLKKFRRLDGNGYRVRVVGRGAATLYETTDPYGWIASFASDLARGLFGDRETGRLGSEGAKAFAGVVTALGERGLDGVLAFLNGRVPHRFTALYRLEAGSSLHCVCLVDKHKHLEPLDLKVVPLRDSFCQFVLRDTLFVTESSASDPRLAGHPYAGVVNSYVGVPVSSQEGQLRGTLCHFDLQAHEVDDAEYRLLEAASQLLGDYLKQH